MAELALSLVARGLGDTYLPVSYQRLARPAPGQTPGDVRARVLAFEGDRTFADFLGPLPPAVDAIFSCAARRATAEPSQLSAGCGIGLFALVWGGKGTLIARNLRGDWPVCWTARVRPWRPRERERCLARGSATGGLGSSSRRSGRQGTETERALPFA